MNNRQNARGTPPPTGRSARGSLPSSGDRALAAGRRAADASRPGTLVAGVLGRLLLRRLGCFLLDHDWRRRNEVPVRDGMLLSVRATCRRCGEERHGLFTRRAS